MQQITFLVLAIVAVALAQQMPDAMRKEMQANMAACKTSEKATQADVDAVIQHQVPSSQTGKCFVGCMLQRKGLINSSGAYSRAAADASAQKEMANNPTMLQNILKLNLACEKEVGTGGTDKCVTGPKLMACMEKNMPARGPPK